MIMANESRDFSLSEVTLANIDLSLKQKKRDLIQEQQSLQKKIKSIFTQMTLKLSEKEDEVLANFKSKLCDMFQNIDSYCSMNEYEKHRNADQINKILNFKLTVIQNQKLKELIHGNVVEVCFEEGYGINGRSCELQNSRTNKKGSQMALKAFYNEQITQLQQRIQKLMLKQEKLKIKLSEIDSKQKMKKIGNTYLPYEDKSISSLLLQRLESENKVLIEQIADCSEKMLTLQSQNSILIKEREHSLLIPTTQKKRACESIHIVEQSVEYSQYQQKISILQMEMQSIKSQFQNQISRLKIERDELMKSHDEQIQILSIKNQQLTNYNQRLYKQCEENIKKKMQALQKLQQANLNLENKCKQNESLKQMNANYAKLIKIKDQKIVQVDLDIKKIEIRLQQSENMCKKLIIQSGQNLESKENIIKVKNTEIDAFKNCLKKQQSEKNILQQKIVKKEEQIFAHVEKAKALNQQIIKLTKQKESFAKKEVNKIKKQLKKQFDEEKVQIGQSFKIKYGEMLQKLEYIKSETKQNKEKLQKKLIISENRMTILKDKVAFETKQMMQKIIKTSQKDKIYEIIQSYIENQSTLAIKNSQIKTLKQQIASIKKQKKQKQIQKIVTEQQMTSELQQFQRKIFQQKLEIQKQIYEDKLRQQQEQYEFMIQQKVTTLQNLASKVQNYQKTSKDLKNEINNISSIGNTQLEQLKKTTFQGAEREKKLQSLVNSLKNSLNKTQIQSQQAKQQLKLKKELINGLKKQLKDKENEKQKLNETINSMIQDTERLKRTTKEANKKEALFEQFKQKLINQTQLSEEITQIKATLEEKQKIHKIELVKKDQIIKQLKANEEHLNKKLKSQLNLQEQISQLKQKLKKSKLQSDRKDTLIKHMKEKQQKTSNQINTTVQLTQNQLKKVKRQLDQEKAQFEGIKFKYRKLETNYQLLKISLVKVYERLCNKTNSIMPTSNKDFHTNKTQTSKNRFEFTIERTPGMDDLSRYKEGLSILQISGQQLQLTNPKSIQIFSPVPYRSSQFFQQDVSKLTELLENHEIDSVPIMEMFNLVLDY